MMPHHRLGLRWIALAPVLLTQLGGLALGQDDDLVIVLHQRGARGTSATNPYESEARIYVDGRYQGQVRTSAKPMAGIEANGHGGIVAGDYRLRAWTNAKGHPLQVRNLDGTNQIPTHRANPTQGGLSWADGINIHVGHPASNDYSAGCLTVHPYDYGRFLAIIGDLRNAALGTATPDDNLIGRLYYTTEGPTMILSPTTLTFDLSHSQDDLSRTWSFTLSNAGPPGSRMDYTLCPPSAVNTGSWPAGMTVLVYDGSVPQQFGVIPGGAQRTIWVRVSITPSTPYGWHYASVLVSAPGASNLPGEVLLMVNVRGP